MADAPIPIGPEGADLAGKERERFAANLFDHLAPSYNRLNRLISWGSDDKWRQQAIAMAKIVPGNTILDIGTGTADLYIPAYRAAQPGGRVIGLDIAPKMLEFAAERIRRELPGAEPELHLRSSEATELPDESVDVAMMGWVLRNVGDRQATYREILRVLKPGGRFVCIETSRPEFPLTRMGNYVYVRWIIPNMVRLAGGDRQTYLYLASSASQFPRRYALAEEWRQAGFRDVSCKALMMGSIAIHLGHK